VLIIVPLYTTGTIHLNEYHEIPVVAPPPPLAPPSAPAGVQSLPISRTQRQVELHAAKLGGTSRISEERFIRARITLARQRLISVASKMVCQGE